MADLQLYHSHTWLLELDGDDVVVLLAVDGAAVGGAPSQGGLQAPSQWGSQGQIEASQFQGVGGASQFQGVGGAPQLGSQGQIEAPQLQGGGGAPQFQGGGGAPQFGSQGQIEASQFQGGGGAPQLGSQGQILGQLEAPQLQGGGGAPMSTQFTRGGGAPIPRSSALEPLRPLEGQPQLGVEAQLEPHPALSEAQALEEQAFA